MKQIFSSFIILFVCILCSCNTEKKENITTEEAKAFAKNIEQQVIDFKIDFLEKNIHFPSLMEKVNNNKNSSKLTGIEEDIKQMLASNNYEESIYNTLGAKGEYKCIRQFEKDGLQYLIFRLLGNNGLNYYEMELTRQNNRVWISDLLSFASGERLSTSIGSLAEKFAQHEGTAIEKSIINSLDRIKVYMRNLEFEKAKIEYLRLPYDIRNDKNYEAVYMNILQQISEQEYMAEAERLTRKYEAKEGQELMLMDMYLAKKDYDKTLAAINRIDSAVGKDPFLDYYRGLIHNMKNEPQKALPCFLNVTRNMPQFAAGYAEVIAHYVMLDDKEKVKKYFKAYKKLDDKNTGIVTAYEERYPYLVE